MSRHIIYGLIDPRTLLVRYVGASSRGLRRAREHRYPCKRQPETYKENWLASLRRAGAAYTVATLEVCPDSASLIVAERFWIAYGRACGWPLTNLTSGGDGTIGYTFSPESRAKMSASHRGVSRRGARHSPEARARMSTSAKLRFQSPEARARMSEARKGQTLTPAHRAKLVAAARARSSNTSKAALARRRVRGRFAK